MSGERRPRIRSIKPEFFSDERINLIPVGARYIAIGLMSMADDRGRIKCMVPAVQTYVFPNGDISETQFKKALRLVIDEAQFAWEYMEGRWTYLWLPRFWRHQVINKPSESTLPPHPRDPYGGLPVREALAEFRRDSEANYDRIKTGVVADSSGSTPVVLPLPRAGTRFRSDPDLVVKDIYDNGQGLAQPEQIDRLCELLASHVHRNDPKADPNPASDRWQTDMRLLLADRKGEIGEVARIIDWCQRDEFWRSNILSPGKLRKQFTQLLLRSGKASPGDPRVLPFGRRAEVIQAANAWQNAPEYRDNGA